MKNLHRILITLLLPTLLTTAPRASGALKTWNGLAGDTLWSTGGNWSPVGTPDGSDGVTFTNLGAAASPLVLGGAVNNVVDESFPGVIASLAYRNTVGFHNTSLLKPLTVLSSSASDAAFLADDGREPASLFVGSGQDDGAAPEVYATISGQTLVVSNGNANVSIMQISATAGDHRATLDLSGLNVFSCVVSNVHVGHNLSTNNVRPTGSLLLAKTNSITATAISVADVFANGSGRTSFLRLGQVNTLNVDRLGVGLRKSLGTLNFNNGLTAPTATFRGSSGVGRQAAWEIGDANNTASSSQGTGIVDLTGGIIDALVERITLGRGQASASAGDGTGTLTFGGGLIDVNYLEIGIQQLGGGSVGRGTLNVNNDAGVGPATLKVNNDLVMAVQLPDNTDASGATAVININGGTLAVAGNILNGDGRSTISLSDGGKLDLRPAGDPTPGNLSVDILNISRGTVTNYGILAVTNINLLSPASEFTVYPGQTLAPAGVGIVGPLSVTGSLKSRGAVTMEIDKTDGVLTSDKVTVTGTLDLGGALTVTLSGNSSLLAGDEITLFSAPVVANSFSTVSLPGLAPGLTWLNNIAINGKIKVVDSSIAPVFVTQPSPASLVCFADASMTFRPAVESTEPIDYRWQVNSVPVSGATNPAVAISGLGLAAPGSYTVRLQASNSLGVAVSDPVSLTVVTNPIAVYTLYSDTFSDEGSVPLNGRQPDVAQGCATWLAGSGMHVSDGRLPYPGHWENYLPLTPQVGHVYTLSVDMNLLAGGGNWMAMGFVNSPNVNSGGFYAGATAWMLVTGNRQNIQTFDNGFGGARSFGPEWFFNRSGYSRFTMVLDTTTGTASSGWTLYYVVDGVLLGDSPYRVYDNPGVLYVGIGGSDGVTGEFDNFLLTDSVVGPMEPTAPTILPAAVEVYANASASFAANTAGACPISYQWRLGGTDIPGATNSTLVISNVQASQTGSISVVVSNSFGVATSMVPSTLTVLPDPVQAVTLYQDSFAGTGGAMLDGRAPEINLLGQSWIANSAMILDSNQLYAPSGGGNQSAYLPFQPEWGHVYVLSIDVNPLTGGGNWVDFGFSPDPEVNALVPDLGGGPWLLQRADRSGVQCFGLGYGSAGSGDGGNAVGYTTWKIVLDTTTGDSSGNTGWTARFVENLPNSFGKLIAKYIYGPNPTIYYLTLGNGGSVGVSANFKNLRLTDSVSPLSITQEGGNIIVSWPKGTLLEGATVNGPWTEVQATSPYMFSPTEPQRFFRVQLQ